jgi:ligand-binding sensor domain-containing protein
MADNPLLERQASRPGRVTTDMLHNLAADLNAEWWVQHMGRRYGVSTDEQGRNYLSWTTVRS